MAKAEEMLTLAHGQAVQDFLKKNAIPASEISLVGFHGQTVFHNGQAGITVQLGDGPMLAELLQRDVIFDIRSGEVAAGGEGAPFVPAYHRALVEASALARPVTVLNIGGISNATWIGEDDGLLAFDIGPGNVLVDDWMAVRSGQKMDKDGACARKGTINQAVLEQLLSHPFFLKRPPKSLDRKEFSLDAVSDLSAEDGAATLAAFSAEAIARSIA